jgi:hypothetical protein
LSDATVSPTATTQSIRATLQPGNIKPFMTLFNSAEPTAEVINITTAKQRNATNVDKSDSEEE